MDLFRTALHADQAARLGSRCYQIITAARYIIEKAQQCGEPDPRNAPRGRFVRFVDMWRVLEEWERAQEKVRPERYQCGDKSCGNTTLKGGNLKKCGGACPEEIKPSYCSKQCQIRVSPRR